MTGLLLIFYLAQSIEKFPNIPWREIETVFTILWSIFYLTCGIDLAVKAGKFADSSALQAASFFSFVAMIIYGVDGILKYRNYQKNKLLGPLGVARGQKSTEIVIT